MIKLAAEPIVSKDNKTGKWYFRIKYYDDGEYHDIRKRGFGTKKAARLAEAEFETILLNEPDTPNEHIELNTPSVSFNQKQELIVREEPISHKLLVKDLYEEYVKYISSRLKAGSVRSASDVLRLFVLPDFGDREVGS